MQVRTSGRPVGLRKLVMVGLLCTAYAIPGGCDLGEFTTTSTVTLNGRDIVSFLANAWILTPIQTAIDNGINNIFEELEDDE